MRRRRHGDDLARPGRQWHWLRPGSLVCAVGANHPSRRELDNGVLGRATFVCCNSLEQSRLESADLIEPVSSGVLDWLEVHELHEVVAGHVSGRTADSDVVVFTSNGLAPGTSRWQPSSCVAPASAVSVR